MSDDFKALIAKVATGAIADARGGRERLRPHDVGRSDAVADGRPADGAARARRDRRRDHRRGRAPCAPRCRKVAAPPDAIDVVGTGGDASGSYNISTCAALDRRGRRRAGRQARQPRAVVESGAADVLGALGVKIDLRPDEIARCIYEAGIGFMFAPAHHPAMKNVAPTRVELGTRTIFNLLGPLSNPAGVKRQMVGVFSRQWVEPLAQVLEESRLRTRLGGARLRRARRDHHVRPDPRRGAGERRGPHLRDQPGGRRPRARRSRRRCAAATPRPTRRR